MDGSPMNYLKAHRIRFGASHGPWDSWEFEPYLKMDRFGKLTIPNWFYRNTTRRDAATATYPRAVAFTLTNFKSSCIRSVCLTLLSVRSALWQYCSPPVLPLEKASKSTLASNLYNQNSWSCQYWQCLLVETLFLGLPSGSVILVHLLWQKCTSLGK